MVRKIVFILFGLLLSSALFAQNAVSLSTPSVNPYADSVAIAKMRVKMDSIRKHRPTEESRADATKGLIANIPEGLLYGYNVYNVINSLTVGYQDSMDFSQLPIPYFCVATDLVSLKAKNWTSGFLVDAMRSTMSIPFYFTPIRRDNMVLVDGGIRNNFPIDLARAMGADYVIGVDLSEPRSFHEVSGLGILLLQSIAMTGQEAYAKNVPMLDVHIRPDVTGVNILSFNPKAITGVLRRGYKAAEAQADGIQAIKKAVGEASSHLQTHQALNINNRGVRIYL